MNAVIDRLTICTQSCAHMHTDCTGQWRCSYRQLFFSPLLSCPSFLTLSIMLTQTNQCTCVLTPKSQSLTCPRVFTSILEGLTSAETNCSVELQHQHSLACLYKLCSFFYLINRACALPYSPLCSIFRLHRYVRPLTTYRHRWQRSMLIFTLVNQNE